MPRRHNDGSGNDLVGNHGDPCARAGDAGGRGTVAPGPAEAAGIPAATERVDRYSVKRDMVET